MESEEPNWDIRNEGRAWSGEEAFARYMLKPHKIELIEGKLLFSNADRAVQLGDPEVWRAAVAKLPR
jgi:hypothetical protein